MPMNHEIGGRRAPRLLLGAVLWRGALLALLWLAFTGAAPGALPYGLGAVGVALAISLALLPPQASRWRPLCLLALVPRLLRLAWIGGIDVALRALRPGMPLDPEWVEIDLDDAPSETGVVLAYLLTMMPGTLAAELDERRLVLHVIDRGQDPGRLARELLAGLRSAETARGAGG